MVDQSDTKVTREDVAGGLSPTTVGSPGETDVEQGDSTQLDWELASEESAADMLPVSNNDVAVAASSGEPSFLGVPLKWLSLCLLTVQTSGQVLLIKWALRGAATAKLPYLNSTLVMFAEVVKVVASLILVVVESGSLVEASACIRRHFAEQPREVAKAAVPALIYTIQNNLMFYSLDKLSAPVQQVLYQMKIITTAGLGVLMLGTALGPTKWNALFMLTGGIALVQWPRDSAQALPGEGVEGAKGFIAVLLACLTSGFAGVYIQKMLQQGTASIWMRNLQFGLFGSLMGLLVAFSRDGQAIFAGGLTQGYSVRVVLVILMNALGGLLCAAMLKYAGATLGCFSTALSIILTCVLSATVLDDFEPDALFVLGTLFSISAVLIYGLGLPAWVQRLLKSWAYAVDPYCNGATEGTESTGVKCPRVKSCPH
jgi:UDP-sugar transporter A1/2/3